MKSAKIIVPVLLAAACTASPLCPAAAAVYPSASAPAVCSVLFPHVMFAAGLISSYYVSCTAGEGCIYISSRTTGPDEAAKIGSVDIQVQRSTNGSTGWTTYTTVPDQLAENASYHYMDSYAVSVPSGYYRVRLTHYAKESGWFFPKTQSATQTSVVVYVA
ncbi:MAG: hypothetical protein J5722_10900 [Oscillospiraceae bacterium]|nr:hypothetical protein [Oscillospiraceae bacterium]